MNDTFLFSALLCIFFTTKVLESCSGGGGGGGGVSPHPPLMCSIHLDDATVATVQWHQCTQHTPATGGEERDIELNGLVEFYQFISNNPRKLSRIKYLSIKE